MIPTTRPPTGLQWLVGGFVWYLVTISFAGAAERNPQIQKAIDRGVAFVRSRQGQNGAWVYPGISAGTDTGATALVGLTLLECGIPASDPQVQQAVQFVRKNAPSLAYTYGLSTSIWFLDRLGDEADVYLIQAMAIRLLAGQNEAGGWTYSCPVPGPIARPDEVRKLMNRNASAQAKKEGDKRQEDAKDKEKKRPELPPDLQEQLNRLAQPPAAPQPQGFANAGPFAAYDAATQSKGDNSNTQFASLGLWVARRYGLPVESALIRTEKRYRVTQMIDGGWTYIPGYRMGADHDRSPAMTCAGLIGLAVGHGAAVEAPKEKKIRVIDPDKDNNMQAGFRHLGDILQEYSQLRMIGGTNDSSFYFLWSMERVAEIYGLKTIGRRDWYAWGSSVLLNSQSEDGGWYGRYHPSGVDSCFALLFLTRANVAKDLSVTLRGKMRDPGTRTLKSGGVGPDALKKKGDKVAETSDKNRAGSPKLVDPKEKLPTNRDGDSPGEQENKDGSTARRMSDDLATASDAQQSELLIKYKEGKGPAYTQALATAIPRLKGENKSMARDALAERLTRMTADTLRIQLKDDDPEIRRAASLACAMKDDKSHVPDLIPLIDDSEPLVARAAHAALKSLTNQDFGPAKDASPKDRAKAIEAWKDWWTKKERK